LLLVGSRRFYLLFTDRPAAPENAASPHCARSDAWPLN
jgi:hypothetical protein